MGRYLIDNNIISNYFSGNYSTAAMEFIAGVLDLTPIISVITEIEALSWVNVERQEEIIKAFVNDAIVLPLSPAVVSECVKIRRGRKIKTPDAIIAATAIAHNLILVTSDNDFAHINGLQIVDPFKL